MPYIGNVSGFDDVDTEQIKDGAVSDVKISDVDHSKVTGLATEISTAVSNLVDSSPTTLNTLNELAAALGDDPAFATTVTDSIATKAPIASPAFTGGIDVTGTVTADGLVVETTATNGAVITASDNSTTNYPLKIQNNATSGRLELGTYGINNNIDLKLQKAGSTKLTVNSTGVNVTGTLAATTVTGNGAGVTNVNATHLGGKAEYYVRGRNAGGSSTDPNTTTELYILSNHSNTPYSSLYWHIRTQSYGTFTSTSNRAQIAIQYNSGTASCYVRSSYSGVWQAWRGL